MNKAAKTKAANIVSEDTAKAYSYKTVDNKI